MTILQPLVTEQEKLCVLTNNARTRLFSLEIPGN
jgi:hypothetical protein